MSTAETELHIRLSLFQTFKVLLPCCILGIAALLLAFLGLGRSVSFRPTKPGIHRITEY